MQLYFVPFRANWELYRPVFRSVHRGRVQLNLPGTRRISIRVGGGGGWGERDGAIKDIGYIWRAIYWVQVGCMIVCEQTLLRDIVRNSFSSVPRGFTAYSLVISSLASISTRNEELRPSSNSQTIVDGFWQVIQLKWGSWNSQKRNPYYLFQIHM